MNEVMTEEARRIGVHSSHCCPKHGCKYSWDLKGNTCPIAQGTVEPKYGDNNGCESCEWEAEERPELANHRYARDVMQIVANADSYDMLSWSVIEGMINLRLDCSDDFHWASADSEAIRPEDVPLLRQCFDDLQAFGRVHGEITPTYLMNTLFAARKRGMRPMRAWLKLHAKEEKAELLALFLACGPERDPASEG